MTTQLAENKTETSHYDADDECVLLNNHKEDDYMISDMMII